MACGDSSDCINRFWNKQYAPITVFKTELKGYGLKATKNIRKGQFVTEYVGEVIPQSMFLKRVREYSEQGVKHFYFMSIKTDQVIDAYKKGNHARFMNHSCVPNCELQKWVVGKQVRMGFFAVVDVAEGEELTFDYKFERYGSEPQICYCGHQACKGVIGGQQKTVMIEGVGLDDGDEIDEEEEKIVGKPRRAGKGGSDDEGDSYEGNKVERGLQTVETVKAFVKLMLYSTSKPVKLIRLLQKLEATDNPIMQRKFLQYHGLLVLKTCLAQYFKSNASICYQTMRILKNLPPISRNSIEDSKIEEVVKRLADRDTNGLSVSELAEDLLEMWEKYLKVYRIPKKAFDQNQQENSLKRNSPEENSGTTAILSSSANSSLFNSNNNSNNNTAIFSAADIVSKRSKFDSPRSNSSNSSEDLLSSRLDASSITGGNNSRTTTATSLSRSIPRPPTTANGELQPQKVIVESVLDTLPRGWKVAKNEAGRMYYYNTELGLSQWDFPRDYTPSSANSLSTASVTPASAAASAAAAAAAVVGNGTSPDGGASASSAVVPEVKVKSSLIEGLSEADYEAIVKKANDAVSGGSPDDGGSAASKVLRALVSEIVVKTLSKHKLELGPEVFKKLARKASHSVLEKEKEKKLQIIVNDGVVTDESKVRIKKYVHIQVQTNLPSHPPICATFCDDLNGLETATFASFIGQNQQQQQRVLVASLPRVELHATNATTSTATTNADPSSSTASVKYVVGVVDKATNTLRVVAAPHMRFRTVVKARTGFKPSPVGAKNTLARHHLGEMFGTIKKKKAIAAMERNKVKHESLVTAVDVFSARIDESNELLPTEDVIKSEIDANRLIPPFNADAAVPANVYNISSIMSNSELDTISVDHILAMQYKEDLEEELNKVYSSGWVFNKIFEALQSKPEKRHLQKLVYILFMMKFKSLNEFAINRPHVMPRFVDNQITASLIEKFTVPVYENGKTRLAYPDRLKDKLNAYILCACLIMDGFRSDVGQLAKDLGVDTAKVSTCFRELGCKVETTRAAATRNVGSTAVLQTPLVFPPPKTGGKKK
ncbi:histone methyltransferase set2 [Physocladia obscura]|uniref:[histone H3]-lysine(36) N-trimethyltransferase n=1 Tax=Physocladia obscura TaxID=109957 RepID=A0AAD5XLN3_9FUNG|nr:histone methyltransferase set2 [Physocladia obscura]